MPVSERLSRLGSGVFARNDRRKDAYRQRRLESAAPLPALLDLSLGSTDLQPPPASLEAIAAALGARYIAPYLGRIGDQGRDGTAEVITMHQALRGVGSEVRLLVASLRQPADLGRLAAAGLDTFTLAPDVVAALFGCAATAAAAAVFEQHAAAGGGNASA